MPLSLLNPSDPDPVRKTLPVRADGPFVLVGDHAGAAIPAALGDLGVSAADRARHIAVDLGTQALGEALSARLAAPFVAQAYSRLVVDCNRAPDHPEWIVRASDGTAIPGNRGLTAGDRAAREGAVFAPYHAAIGAALEGMDDPVLVSVHSFTPVMSEARRPWEIGVLHDGHREGFALAVLAALRTRGDLVVGDNEPYRMDATDYTVPRHAYGRGLRYVEIEVRQDLLADAAGVERMAAVLASALGEGLAQ
ncbi:N-formylglutamate amidohydrolase [Tsuneonella amylolytica]|uniref:N-formylglutamate amidohydrolase n=1 Tax=Tsuneonella amylolytica TaxID=2338327 RepID=UPI000EA87241|nr:N-formylglutamate amidohydrolase [Tsuneonella amylolytica]